MNTLQQSLPPSVVTQVIFTLLVFLSGLIAVTNDAGLTFFVALSFLSAALSGVLFMYQKRRHYSRTETKEIVQGQIHSSDSMFTELYYNSPVPYLLIDHEGVVMSANVAALRLFKLKQQQIEQVSVFDRLHSELTSHVGLMVEKFRSGISVTNEELQLVRSDGEMAWVLLSLFSFKSITRQRLGVLTLVDVTKQKQTEQAKSEFVSLASHQLRTPIAGMKWSAELLLMDQTENLTDRQTKYIHRLIASIERMSVLVDDFLRVSRFELGTFKLEQSTFDVKQLIESIVQEQEYKIKTKRIKVKLNLAIKDELSSDVDLFRMIITNLFSNAVKYTRELGTIHVGVVQQDDGVEITVADNGMGIPPGEQDRVFSKLFRASNAAKQVPDGTGLGLYIVREAVRVLRGNVTFTSAEDLGTTFTVVVPLSYSQLADSGLE